MKLNHFYLLIFSLLIFSFVSCNQSDIKEEIKKEREEAIIKERITFHSKVYQKAIEMKDYSSALTYVYAIMADDSNETWYDTLAQLYTVLDKLQEADKLTELRSEVDPNNTNIQYLKAQTLLSKGDVDGAVNMFKKLYEASDSIKYLFDLVGVYQATNKTKQFTETLAEIKKHRSYKTYAIETPSRTGEKQLISAQAAVLFYESYADINKGNFTSALKKLDDALKIQPDFEMASELKNRIKTQMSGYKY
jgi:tetratricopeptide (TPR) repeat protein